MQHGNTSRINSLPMADPAINPNALPLQGFSFNTQKSSVQDSYVSLPPEEIVEEVVPPYSGKPRVVVLGAGYAGAKCARVLQNTLGRKINLSVVEKRRYSVHKFGGARAAALGRAYAERILTPNSNLVKKGKGELIQESILSITNKSVTLSGSRKLYYDYLVCCTGGRNLSLGEPPLKYREKTEMMKYYDKISRKIQKATTICIIGGGPVGVETAGEIKFQYPEKLVCIVHSGKQLLNRVKPPPVSSFHHKLLDQINEMGIGLYLNQKLDLPKKKFKKKPYLTGPREFKTSLGQSVSADLFLLCTGKTLSNNMYPKKWMDPSTGQLHVRTTLQLVAASNVFACGDINDFPENKQGYFSMKQGAIAAKNVAKLVKNRTKRIEHVQMTNYKSGFGTGRSYLFVSLGREQGVSNVGYLSLGKKWTAKIKSKNLGVKEFWNMYNQKTIPQEHEVSRRTEMANYYDPSTRNANSLQSFDTMASMQSVDSRVQSTDTRYSSGNSVYSDNSTMSRFNKPAPTPLVRYDKTGFQEKSIEDRSQSMASYMRPTPPSQMPQKMAFSNNPRPTSYNPRASGFVPKRKSPRRNMISRVLSRGNVISFVGARDSAALSTRLNNNEAKHKTFFKPLTDVELNNSTMSRQGQPAKRPANQVQTMEEYNPDISSDEEDERDQTNIAEKKSNTPGSLNDAEEQPKQSYVLDTLENEARKGLDEIKEKEGPRSSGVRASFESEEDQEVEDIGQKKDSGEPDMLDAMENEAQEGLDPASESRSEKLPSVIA